MVNEQRIRLAQLNARNAKCWADWNARDSALLAIPEIASLAAEFVEEGMKHLRLSTHPAQRIKRFHQIQSFHTALEAVAKDIVPGVKALQQRRTLAKAPRGILKNGKTLSQIVIEIFAQPQFSTLSAKDAWNQLPDILQEFDILLTEQFDADNPERDKYTYPFRGRTKALGRKHFQNLLTKSRKKIPNNG